MADNFTKSPEKSFGQTGKLAQQGGNLASLGPRTIFLVDKTLLFMML